ncbi:MAG TPA: hypothetical protein VHQ22_01330 [Terriglobales bacterium]|nr:hypothetical protein [Terriglobales bacterium]
MRGADMSSGPERVNKLSVAGAFCLFDKKLSSSGNSSIVWGALNALIGALILNANNRWGFVSLLLGLGLIAAGLYERKVRDPKVIIISAATLGVLALWEFALIGLAAAGKAHLALGGRTLYWGIAQAWGSYTTWKTYHTYKTLRETSDPLTVEEVREYINQLKKAKPGESLDLIEFEMNPGFGQARRVFRLKPIDDLYLIAEYKAQFRSLQLQGVSFVARNQVLLTAHGEKWMSKKIKATVQLGPTNLEKVSITPEMAMRMNPAARAVALGTT